MQNLEYALPALDLIQLVMKMIDSRAINQGAELLKTSVQQFNQFFVNMCNQLESEEEN